MNGKYIIKSSDELNVQVLEKFEKKIKNEEGKYVGSGEFDYKVISYHPNLEKAYNWIIDKEINISNIEELSDVIKTIKELKVFVRESLAIQIR